MRYFSMFSGIGCFELSFPGDWECVGFSEINPESIAIYKYHFPNHKNYGNAKKIKGKELPDFDLLCAGFPCQAFSISGQRRGFNDTRGTLFFDIARIAKEKRPKHLLLENVEGLLSHDQGRTFKIILSTLTEMGYNVQTMVLNSKYHGVPQNRERIFFIGHLGERSIGKILPVRKSGEWFIGSCEKQSAQTEAVGTITTGIAGGGHYEQYVVDYRYDEGLRLRDEFVSPTLLVGNGHRISNIPLLIQKYKEGKIRIRKFTENELERLQGLPIDWTKYGNYDNGTIDLFGERKIKKISFEKRSECIGNGLTTNVAEFVRKNFI